MQLFSGKTRVAAPWNHLRDAPRDFAREIEKVDKKSSAVQVSGRHDWARGASFNPRTI